MNARRFALEAIEKIIREKAFSNLIISEYLNKFSLSKEDKKFFTQLVYGTVENQILLNYYLEPFIGQKTQKTWVKILLYMSVYQIVFMKMADYAVVNESVEIASIKNKQIGSFVNAVLRNFLRTDLRKLDGLDEITELSIKYSYPIWIIKNFLNDYSYEKVKKILEENSSVKKTHLRVNTLKTTNSKVEKFLLGRNYEIEKSKLVKNGFIVDGALIKSELFEDGLITFQDVSSQLVAEVVNPKDLNFVVDLCSAPGGKTSHMSALMENKGKILACDIFQHKANLMKKTFERLGCTNIEISIIDGRLIKNIIETETVDALVIDAPCSGLGVIRDKPDIKFKLSDESINEVIQIQKELLESSYEIVKKGGSLTYSTCTINSFENQKQISNFLKNHTDFEKEYEKIILPYEYHSDGFYICKLRRK
ncbi:MAG: 16S rRNA (cytosine(967)-C(5))-methyltransferase RsmB [Bacilli bacterium]|nr:16S rRNA (cytosine(967)-C(5))-methyltransferase RsmB [Bacilli bacterium]